MTSMNLALKVIRSLSAAALILLTGCASLTVTPVTQKNESAVKGVRYYLPKPYIQVTPQADGTVAVDVIYLPDLSHEYAIDTSSHLSAYTFQISRDEKGLLTSVEYKANTAIVGQQLASSAGAAAVQAYNIGAAQLAASQTQVNAAQTAADQARANAAAATATLASDKAHGASASTLTSDYAAVSQAEAKAQIAEEALQRAQKTVQAVSTSVAAGTIATTTAPAIGTAFGQPTWNTPIVDNLPGNFGPVLFAVNDVQDEKTGQETVALKAVMSDVPGSGLASPDNLQEGVVAQAQRTFETTSSALGPPTLGPSGQAFPLSAKQATFFFDRPIKSLATGTVTTDTTPPVVANTTAKASTDGKSLTIDISSLSPGAYVLTAKFNYVADSSGRTMSGIQQVKFTVTVK